MTNWYEKFKSSMTEAIENGWDLRAVNTANHAHEFARLGRITRSQADEIQAMYTAWMATWDTEEAAPAEEIAPAQQRTVHIRQDAEMTTTSAAEALGWHRAGDDVIIARPGGRSGYLHGAPQKPARTAEDENRAHCKHIAGELDAYVNGDIRRCPDCGEEIRRDWDEVGDAFKCPHCGEISDPDDWEQLSVWDFLGDCYDIEYRCDGRRELRSVCVMVACGGPNIYLDTASKDVELYWWSERARYPLSYEAVEALDDWAAEMWGCC